MIRSPCSHDRDALRNRFLSKLLQVDAPRINVNAAVERVANYYRLFMNLLQHEVLKTLLLRRRGVPLNRHGRTLKRSAVRQRVEGIPMFVDLDNVTITQGNDAMGIVQQRRSVRAQHHLPLPHAQD